MTIKAEVAGTSHLSNIEVIQQYDGLSTNTTKNANKMYHMELQRGDEGWRVWVRYGRVDGTKITREYLENRELLEQDQAEWRFNKLAKEKFGRVICEECKAKGTIGIDKCPSCDWYYDIDSYTGKYGMVFLAQSAIASSEGRQLVNTDQVAKTDQIQTPTTIITARKLDALLEQFVGQIYEEAGQVAMGSLNTGALSASTSNPLGTLGTSQLMSARQTLGKIKTLLEQDTANPDDIARLSQKWFGAIPQSVGMYPNWESLYLTDMDKYREAIELLDLLEDIKGVVSGYESDDIVSKYDAMKVSINVISPTMPEWKRIEQYIRTTHGSNHHQRIHKINAIFEVAIGHQNSYDLDQWGNVSELFHGSRNANILGILAKGLLIRPAGVATTGAMFGHGVYFADCSTKSLNYCGTGYVGGRVKYNNNFLFLADVALGKQEKVSSGWGTYGSGLGYDSIFAQKGSRLYHNEFIIYNHFQHKIRYVVSVDYS